MECEIIAENNNSHRSMLPTASIPLQLNSNISESTPAPNFGRVALEECSQVTFGNQHFYHGPITSICDKNTRASATDGRPDKSMNKNRSGLRKQFGELYSAWHNMQYAYNRRANDFRFRQDLAIKEMEIYIHCHRRRRSNSDYFYYIVESGDDE